MVWSGAGAGDGHGSNGRALQRRNHGISASSFLHELVHWGSLFLAWAFRIRLIYTAAPALSPLLLGLLLLLGMSCDNREA